jgi:hypothetical protein
MHGVYRGCYVNISATVSKDTSQRLFRTRPHWWCIPDYTYLEDTSRGVIFSSSARNPVRFGSLNTRAWVLQERILSPRILHFAEGDLLGMSHSQSPWNFHERHFPRLAECEYLLRLWIIRSSKGLGWLARINCMLHPPKAHSAYGSINRHFIFS